MARMADTWKRLQSWVLIFPKCSRDGTIMNWRTLENRTGLSRTFSNLDGRADGPLASSGTDHTGHKLPQREPPFSNMTLREYAKSMVSPGRLYKMASSEGGIRVPFVAQWPKTLEGVRGPITDQFSTCMDLLPTFLALAGGSHPGPGTYKGREVLGMTGQDWTPWLKGQSDHIWPPDFNLGWELHGRAAYRRGNYKILWMREPVEWVYFPELRS